jgi:hypothetical protein
MKTLSARSIARAFRAHPTHVLAAALAALAALSLAGCSDQSTTPAAVKPGDKNSIIVCGEGCAGGGGPVDPPISVSPSLTTSTLSINAFNETSYKVTILNHGATVHNVTFKQYLQQGTNRVQESSGLLDCGWGAGVVPNSGCQVTKSAVATSVTSGSSALVPGAATFQYDVIAGGTTYTGTTPVTLEPGITGFTVTQNLSLHGIPFLGPITVASTATTPLSDVHILVWLAEGNQTRIVANTWLTCGAGLSAGTLPAQSSCTTTVPLTLNVDGPGQGTFVPGPATQFTQLFQGSKLLQTRTWTLTVDDARIASPPSFTAPLVIDGPKAPFPVTLTNNGSPIPSPVLEGYIIQGTAKRSLEADFFTCGASGATLPTGTCTTADTLAASNSAFGTGTLVPGSASVVFVLKDRTAVADTVIVPVTLASNAPPTTPPPTSPTPSIGAVAVSGAAVIGAPGPNTPVAITFGNTGGAVPNGALRMMILQGSSERYATSGSLPFNCGSGNGVVPTGGCTVNATFFASNTAPGTGTFTAGAAKLIVYLVDPANAVLATKTVPLTLAAP